MGRTLVWFRGKDCRLRDHAPLRSALDDEGEVVLLFVLDPYFFSRTQAAQLPHRIQYLLDALRELEANVASRGSRLLVVPGKSVDVVPRLAKELHVSRVVAYRWTEPFARERDRRIAEALEVPFELFEGETLVPPGAVRNQSGKPFAVFTPFSRAVAKILVERPLGPPIGLPRTLPPLPPSVKVATVPVPTAEDLGLVPNRNLTPGGEHAARIRLRDFVFGPAKDYANERDRMDHAGTSRISQDLKFGTVSVRTVWDVVTRELEHHPGARRTFLNEIVWREFAYHTLWDRPEVLTAPFRKDFAGFPYRDDPEAWKAWTLGTTGYPVVDASARQLLAEGFVHNRARMISASFLTKHLLVDYREGEAHYMKWLTDGDWASNDAGWQWSSGSGCDAQPYFRVFNPVTQGERFDPDGEYVRKYVPELARMSAKYIHAPWAAPKSELERAGVVLGKTYPPPIVDHAKARARFLATAKSHFAKVSG